ncbi:MAG TPA: hypothetical protein VNE16_02285 [Vicinamibacterales bacterium]|nr:hypothetical protein [Vicinamibacterales bacterium]
MHTKALGAMIVAAVCSALLGACGGIHPSRTALAPPAAPACQSRNYGTVTFQNQSKTATQTVLVNGVRTCVLPPGHSLDVHLKAGVSDTVRFYVTNTATIACGDAPLKLARCQTRLFYCAYP